MGQPGVAGYTTGPVNVVDPSTGAVIAQGPNAVIDPNTGTVISLGTGAAPQVLQPSTATQPSAITQPPAAAPSSITQVPSGSQPNTQVPGTSTSASVTPSQSGTPIMRAQMERMARWSCKSTFTMRATALPMP